MATKQKYIIEFDAETGKFSNALEEVKTGVDDVKAKTGELKGEMGGVMGKVDSLSGGMVSGFKNGLTGVKGLIKGMNLLKVAIISTGIGAIVVAVVALIQAVSRLQGVQDKYKAATAALSAVFDVLMDSVAFLGEALINAFSDPQKAISDFGNLIKENIMNRFDGLLELIPKLNEAIILLFKGEFAEAGKVALDAVAKVTTGVENFTDEMVNAGEKAAEYARKLAETAIQAYKLEVIEQRLLDLQISQIKTQAQRNKQIAEARLLAEDETKSFEEREAALQNALDLETKNLAEKLANARTEASLIKQRNALSESSREDKRAEAEAVAKVYELEEQSLKQQKRIFTEIQALQKEREAARQKALKEAEDAYKEYSEAIDEINKTINEATATQEEKELMALEEKYNKLLDLAVQYNEDTKAIEEAREFESLAIRNKFREAEAAAAQTARDKEIADARKLQDAKIAIAGQAIGALNELVNSFTANTEKGARRQFAISKILGVSEAVINTSRAIIAQIANPDPTAVVTGRNWVQAGIAAAMGAAQVAKIASTQFGGGASSSGGVSVPSGGGQSAPQQTAPQVDFSFLQQGANQNTIQAYVIAQNVTNSTQANQLVQDQAAL